MKNKNKEIVAKITDRYLDDMHLDTIGNTRLNSRGGGGAPLRDQYGNVVAGRSPDRNPHLRRNSIGTPRSNIGTPIIVQTANGINALNVQNPFIIPGISPVPTSVVFTNYPQFGDGQPIAAQSLILPSGQPFVPSPAVFLNGSQSLPNLNPTPYGLEIGNNLSPVRQGIADFIKVGSGVIHGTSYGITAENYDKYKRAKEENDLLNELEYTRHKRLYPDYYPYGYSYNADEDIRRRYLLKDDLYGRSSLGKNWWSSDPYWWDDYYWGGVMGSRHGKRFDLYSRYGKRPYRRYYDDYPYEHYDDHWDPYYRGYGRNDWWWYNRKDNAYKGKRDPNASKEDYGWWYGIADQKDRPPYYFDLPPPWVRHENWNPYLWRRDQPPPFWMHGDDKKWHWEFKKEWERWYKGESKDWWDKFVPEKFKGKVEDLVNNKINKLADDLNEKERKVLDQITDLRNSKGSDGVKIQRYLEEIHRLK